MINSLICQDTLTFINKILLQLLKKRKVLLVIHTQSFIFLLNNNNCNYNNSYNNKTKICHALFLVKIVLLHLKI